MNQIVKRLLDIFLSLILMVILSPFFVLIAFLVILTMGRPVFFKQKRVGKDGKQFEIYKFRTMKNTDSSQDGTNNDFNRITRFGRFLRAFSLDEIPQFINILKGEMSVVGPRALLVEYMSVYTEEEMRRHKVRPGLTGLAQVMGRNSLSWKDKFKYDIYYVENQSFYLDLKIIVKTIFVILKLNCVNQSETTTMSKYDGTN